MTMLMSTAAAVLLQVAAAATPGPMRGWMTWERYTCETDCLRFPDTCISERLIRTMADAMQREGFVDAGYEYIQIDDCWAASQRDASGAIIPDPVRFPSGMRALADYVHGKGMKLGLCAASSCQRMRTCCRHQLQLAPR